MGERFDKQKVLLKEVKNEVCYAIFDSFKKNLKEEMEKKIDKQLTKIKSDKSRSQS